MHGFPFFLIDKIGDRVGLQTWVKACLGEVVGAHFFNGGINISFLAAKIIENRSVLKLLSTFARKESLLRPWSRIGVLTMGFCEAVPIASAGICLNRLNSAGQGQQTVLQI